MGDACGTAERVALDGGGAPQGVGDAGGQAKRVVRQGAGTMAEFKAKSSSHA